MLTDGGVSPISGYPSGGYNVTICGTNLSAGTTGDVTSVTICGATADVVSVSGSTQIVVVAGASSSGPLTGDVVVNSEYYGTITAAHAFTYKRGVISLIGTNGAIIESGDAASAANGSDFGTMAVGQTAVTNTFTYYNSGNDTLNLRDVVTAGAGAGSFTITSYSPTNLVPGATGSITIVCASQGGEQNGEINFRDSVLIDPSIIDPFIGHTVCVFRVKSYGTGAGMGSETNQLAFSATYGDANPSTQSITITNTGNDTLTCSNMVVYATAGDNWLTVAPTGGTIAVDGSIIFTNSLDISSLNVGTHYATVQVYSATATNSPYSYGVEVTIAQTTQTLGWSNPGEQTYTNETDLTATNSGGLTPSYTVASGPATVHYDRYPAYVTYSSTGEVTVVASQAGNMNYTAADSITQSWDVTRSAGVISLTNLTQEYTGSAITADVVTSPTDVTYTVTYDTLSVGPTNVGTYEAIALITDPLIYGGVTNTLTITKASQVITFPAIAAQLTNATVGLTATGGASGNSVTFSVVDGPGVLDTTNLTFSGSGDVLVKASQAGAANYFAAPDVTNRVHAFSVTPNNGPLAGGNSVIISNGSLGTVTNVLVEWSSSSVSPDSTATNWLTLIMPAATNAGLTDITLQSTEYGDILLADAYTYNPAGSIGIIDWSVWQEVNPIPEDRQCLGSAAVLSNALYVGGGKDSSSQVTNVFRMSADGTWSQVAGLPVAADFVPLVTYRGEMYALGGRTVMGPRNNVYRYNGETWVSAPGLPEARCYGGAAALGDDLFYFGGMNAGSAIVDTTYRYDGTSWTAVNAMPAALRSFGYAVYDGAIYTMGGYDGSSLTNVYRFDGSTWTQVVGLPAAVNENCAAALDGKLYSMKGSATNVYCFDGSSWSSAPATDGNLASAAAGTFNGFIYVVGGYDGSSVSDKTWRYPYGESVSPASGSWTGGYPVTISGTNLGNGVDITNVTFCGVTAAIQPGQSATQLIVLAGAATVGQSGDVVVQSTSFGTTTKSNAFTYIAPTLTILGTNGAAIMSDGAASLTDGSKFYATQPNEALTYTFGLTNTGNDVLNISGWTTNEADADLFIMSTIPTPIAVGGVTNFTVTYTPVAVGIHTAQVAIASDDPTSPFLFNLVGSCFTASTNVGPYAGGNTVTITNGYFGTITNVLVGSAGVSPAASGDNWFTIELPAASAAGAVDFVVQTSDNGSTLLRDAYTYNWAGTLLDQLPAVVSLTNTWLNGTNGTTFIGADNSGFMGCSVSTAGDMNNDGIDDFIIGAEWADNRVSHAYVVYGRTGTYPVDTVLTNTWLDGVNGMWLRGLPYQALFGNAVSDAGDVNGDGLDDMMIGSYQYDANGQWHAGQAFLVYGNPGGLPSYIAANGTYMGTATNATKLGGSHRAGEAATSVSSAGDVNGDGLTDLLVGAPEANPGPERGWAGETYLVYGSTNTLPNQVVLTNTWLDGVNGMIFAGAVTNDKSGEAVSSAGDVNGDGLDDFLIGARYADPDGRESAGEVYLVYGRTNMAAHVTLTNTWFDGTNGVLFSGAEENNWAGQSVSEAGDVNGDGLGDFLIGATGYDPDGGARTNAGATYLVYGTTNGLPGTVTLTNTWFDGVNGVMLLGAATNDYSGVSVASGDINGDGLSDVLIGAGFADPDELNGGGETYLIYGRSGLPAQITLNDSWLDGTNGVILAGREFQCFAGNAVSGGGDYNADGYDDMLIGAEQANPEGETYLVYGSPVPVVPSIGSWTGGYPIVISGKNMGNSDVTNVTICGLTANIISQSFNRVWVAAPTTTVSQVGDVVVQSVSYGTTIRSNGFTYVVPTLSMLGTNGAAVASGEAVSPAKGTIFYPVKPGTPDYIYTFAITNSGNGVLSISGWTTNGANPDKFFVVDAPSKVAVGGVSNLEVAYYSTEVGTHSAAISFASDDPTSPFLFNVGGSCFSVSTNVGPYAGGNTITITNGYFGDITNILVGSAGVSPASSGPNWFTIELPPATASGPVDFTVQTSDNGDTLLRSAYTYNPAGLLETVSPSSGSWTGNYPVVINGTNLCNGNSSDITEVILAGMTAVVQNVYGSTQIVVTADTSSYGYGTGDVVVVSVGYGTSIKSNAFIYTAPNLGVYGTNDAAIASGAAAAAANGTDFGSLVIGLGGAVTNTFSITNSGNTALIISGVTTSGAAGSYTAADIPAAVEIGGISNFIVVFQPVSGGTLDAALNFANNGTNGSFVLNLTAYGLGGGIGLATNRFSFTGTFDGIDPAEQSLVVTNFGVSSFTYTNVLGYGGDSGWLTTVPNNGTLASSNSMVLANRVDLSGMNAGTHSCTVTVTAADATNSPQNYVVSLTVAKANQTISFPSISDQITTNHVILAATSDSGLPVSFAVGSGSASISGGTNLTFTGAGSVRIVASQAGNSNYNAAVQVTNTFMVTKAVAGVTLTNLSQTYNGTARTVGAVTVPGGLTVNKTYDGSTTAPVSAGSYAVTGVVDDVMYQGTAIETLTVAKASQSINFQALSNVFWTNGATVSASASSGLGVTFSIAEGPATVNGGTNIVCTGIGAIAVAAHQSGNGNYNAAPNVTNSFQALGPQFVLQGTNGAVIESSGSFQLADGTDFGEAIIGLNILTNTFTLTNSGNANLSISSIATNGSPSFTLSLTSSVLSASSVVDIPVTFNPQAGGSNTTAFTFTFDGTNSPYTLNVGGFGLGGSIVLSTNKLSYTGVYGGSNLHSQIVTMGNNGLSSFTFTNHLTALWQSAAPLSGTVATGAVWQLTNTVDITGLNAGSYSATSTISAVDATNSPQQITLSLTVEKAPQTITFPNPGAQLTTNVTTLSADASSGLPVSYEVMSGSAALDHRTNGTYMTYTGAGAVVVRAVQSGNSNWLAAVNVTQVFAVAKTPQAALSFTPATPQLFNTTNVLSTTGGSGTGLVSYAVTSGGGTIQASSLVLTTGTGSVVVVASKDADDMYLGTAATATVVCAKDRAAVTLNGLARVYDGAAKTVTATTVPSGLGVGITYDSGYVVPSNAGSYTVVGEVQDHRYHGGATGTLVIARGIDTITFSQTNQVFDWGAPRFVVSNSAHAQPVQLTYNGQVAAPTNAGIYAVTGLVDAANWAATNATLLTVAQATQTISFASIPNQMLTNEVTLSATAASALSVTFAVADGPAVISGGTNLTFTNVGWVAISCVQTGDLNWMAAVPVTNRFEVLAIPGVTSPTVADVTATTATLGATITATNGTPVLTRGVVWATNGSVEVSTGVRVCESGAFGTGAYTLSVTSLPPATLISIRGYAVNVAGTNQTVVTNFWTVPVAPGNLSETNVLDMQFEAQWGAVYGATNYLLDVAYDATFSNSVPGYAQRLTGSEITAAVTGIVRGAQCWWRVRAENQGGASLWSVTNAIDLPQAQLEVLGTNGLPFADHQAASVLYGTDYGFVPTNQIWSRTFSIRNNGPTQWSSAMSR